MSQFLLYQSEDGRTKLDVRLDDRTVWLSQKQLTDLFGKAKVTISEHIKHIFGDEELEPAATVRLFRTVQTEGAREVVREVEHYNLDMVLALGFRVRSPMAMRFRQWAADKLKEPMPARSRQMSPSPTPSGNSPNSAAKRTVCWNPTLTAPSNNCLRPPHHE